MSESIYRFISFENFVDTVQRKALCFVHPSVFDDPLEFQYLQSYSLKNAKHRIEILAKLSQINRMFVQSWTKLSESDALWRIYKYNTFSVRIEIDLKDIELLDDVNSADVIYTDTPNDIIDQYASQNGISAVRQMAIKRTAFSHEQEVRLIHHERWDDEDDGLNNCYFTGAFTLKDDESRKILIEKYKDLDDDQWIHTARDLIHKYNVLGDRKTCYIDYAHIDSFIKSVMVNPFAPDWFVDTVKMFCDTNKIKFLGKSKLYSKDTIKI